jgi:hypothetical protein
VVWWGASMLADDVARVELTFRDQLSSIISARLLKAGIDASGRSYADLFQHAMTYGDSLLDVWARHIRGKARRALFVPSIIPFLGPSSESGDTSTAARVLTVVSQQVPIHINYSLTRWCVDSGANRDICREVALSGVVLNRKLS